MEWPQKNVNIVQNIEKRMLGKRSICLSAVMPSGPSSALGFFMLNRFWIFDLLVSIQQAWYLYVFVQVWTPFLSIFQPLGTTSTAQS